jgi:hypothetical protein
MSVTFSASAIQVDYDDPLTFVSLANVNAADLMTWIGLPTFDVLVGELPVGEVAAKCRRRLWPIPRNDDAGSAATVEGRRIQFARRPGYLRETTARLLELCDRAGTGSIRWY